MTKTYLFYDIETTGLNKAFDQVLSVSKEDRAWVVKWIKDEYDIEVK